MKTNDARVVRELKTELEHSGLKPGSPEFEEALRARKVDLCKQAQRVDSCWNCRAFDHCQLIKQHLIDLHYGSGNGKQHQNR